MHLAEQLPQTSDPRPDAYSEAMGAARDAKNRGAYEAAATSYVELMRRNGVIHVGVLRGVYQCVAAGGYLDDALHLALLGKEIYDRNPATDPVSQQMLSAYHSDIGRLLSGATSVEALTHYLAAISGNERYRLPRDYGVMTRELADACEEVGEDYLQNLVWTWQQYERRNPSFEVRALR